MSTPLRPGTGGAGGAGGGWWGLAKGTGWGGERRGGGLQHLSGSLRPSPSISSSFSSPLCYHIPPSVWLSWILKLYVGTCCCCCRCCCFPVATALPQPVVCCSSVPPLLVDGSASPHFVPASFFCQSMSDLYPLASRSTSVNTYASTCVWEGSSLLCILVHLDRACHCLSNTGDHSPSHGHDAICRRTSVLLSLCIGMK